MKDLLMAVRCGRISFGLFERRTRPIWRAMAESLLRRWKGPASISAEDVMQELILGAWIFVAHWSPERLGTDGKPVSIDRYVVFNSMDKAKKWLHQQRNAYRRDDRSPGRFERPFSSFQKPGSEIDAEQALLDLAAVEPVAEQALLDRQHALMVVARTPREHQPAMAAIVRTGDVDLAAQYLASQPAAFVLGHDSIALAHRAVVRALRTVAAA
jgi:hypothetical protein